MHSNFFCDESHDMGPIYGAAKQENLLMLSRKGLIAQNVKYCLFLQCTGPCWILLSKHVYTSAKQYLLLRCFMKLGPTIFFVMTVVIGGSWKSVKMG